MKLGASKWLLVATATCMLIASSLAVECIAKGPCSCDFGDQGEIDLSSLGGMSAPAWPNLKPSEPKDPSTYALNVCYGFNLGSCNGVTCCQTHGSLTYACGKPTTVAYSVDPGTNNVIMAYTGDGGRAAIITLVCDKSATAARMEAQGENPNLPSFYRFTLTSKCACPGGCTGGDDGGGDGGSGIIGWVLIGIFFGAAFIYLIAGVIFMRFKMQSTGLDLIPNRSFWTGVPGAIKEGVMFFVSPITKRGGYQKT